MPDAPSRARLAALSATAIVVLAAGCGDEDRDESATTGTGAAGGVRIAPAPRIPSGFRLVENGRQGFSLAVPRRWDARIRRGATLIRSDDRLLALTIGFDASPEGRRLQPPEHALATLRELPGFEDVRVERNAGLSGSPYEAARIDAAATLVEADRRQRIAVASIRIPGRGTLSAIAFQNADIETELNERALRRSLATLRATR